MRTCVHSGLAVSAVCIAAMLGVFAAPAAAQQPIAARPRPVAVTGGLI
jgi:hypothetical protein